MTKGHQKHSSHLQEEAAQKGSRARGTLLTIAIVLVIVNHLFLAGAALYDLRLFGSTVHSLFIPILLVASVASVIGGIVMWLWKRWGYYLYIGAALVVATALLLNTGSILMLFAGVLPPIIVAYIVQPKLPYFD